MRDLHRNGDITLYGSAVIVKDDEGQIFIKHSSDDNAVGTIIGMATGATAGFFFGPIAGAAAAAGTFLGATAGTVGGMLYDLHNYGIDSEFASDVARSLAQGHVALVADVEEEWTSPTNYAMEKIGGEVYRRVRSDVAYEQFQREMKLFRDELEELKHEWKNADKVTRKKVKNEIDETRYKMRELSEKTKEKLENGKRDFDQKINHLKKQAKTAHDEQKAKIEHRIEAIKADYTARKAMIEQSLATPWDV